MVFSMMCISWFAISVRMRAARVLPLSTMTRVAVNPTMNPQMAAAIAMMMTLVAVKVMGAPRRLDTVSGVAR